MVLTEVSVSGTFKMSQPPSECFLPQLSDWRMIQEERAEHHYRVCTLRRFLRALLDHVTQERLVEQERQELAQQHNNRSAAHHFPLKSLMNVTS